MREVISVNVGQAGVQLSNAAWELLCSEHGILANGALKDYLHNEKDSYAFHTFFQQVPGGQYVPRAVSVDLEATVLDEVRTGAYRNLWHPDQLISGIEDAANNYARGHFTLGKTLVEDCIECVRRAADCCDILQGFIVTSSMGGGTGSGFSSLILERLSVEFTKRQKYQIIVVPSTTLATSVVDPYNCVLTLASSGEHSELCTHFENEAVFRICCGTLDIARPTYNNLNRVIAQILSSMTVSLRYESSLNADLDQINTNLVPYPRIHFPAVNYTPIISLRRADHQQLTCRELMRNLFDHQSQMVCCDMLAGKYMSCCLQFRGDITPKQVNTSVFDIKRRTDIKFVSWCPTGFKLGISSQPPTTVPNSEMAPVRRSAMMMTNSTSICQLWKMLGHKFKVLFSKRSFVHWYVGEGMEEGEFNEAHDDLNSLIADYEECAYDDVDLEEEETGVKASMAPPPVLSLPTDAGVGETDEEVAENSMDDAGGDGEVDINLDDEGGDDEFQNPSGGRTEEFSTDDDW